MTNERRRNPSDPPLPLSESGADNNSLPASPGGAAMTRPSLLLSAFSFFSIVAVGTVSAQISVFQSSDGTTGTITHLGDSFSIYSDSHGNTGTITNLGGGFQSYSFTNPQGGTTTDRKSTRLNS